MWWLILLSSQLASSVVEQWSYEPRDIGSISVLTIMHILSLLLD